MASSPLWLSREAEGGREDATPKDAVACEQQVLQQVGQVSAWRLQQRQDLTIRACKNIGHNTGDSEPGGLGYRLTVAFREQRKEDHPDCRGSESDMEH